MAPDPCTIDQAARVLIAGGPVVFPTDTVFGLGVSVEHAATPAVLYQLKGRDEGKPIAWLVSGVDDLSRYGADVPPLAFDLARAWWPGALTLIVKASSAVPAAFQSAEGTIGLRTPDNPTAMQLIRAVGCPLSTTSANLSGLPATGDAAQLDPALTAKVQAVVLDSEPRSGKASTVIDCTKGVPKVLRAGAITQEDIDALTRKRAAKAVARPEQLK